MNDVIRQLQLGAKIYYAPISGNLLLSKGVEDFPITMFEFLTLKEENKLVLTDTYNHTHWYLRGKVLEYSLK